MQNALAGKRVLITQAEAFMGPALCEVFAEQGAQVVRSDATFADLEAAQRLANQAGEIDVLVANLAIVAPSTPSTDSAARGAQLAYVQALGAELAPKNIQVNAIAQNFVDNPTYFPPEVQANPRFQERLAREVPLGRLVSAREDALFAAYLCSDGAHCFVGQVFPVCGGWVAR